MVWFFVSVYAWLGVVFSSRYYWVSFLCLLVFASGFRYYVGSDFDDYVYLFQDSVSGKDVPVEISYPLIAKALSFFGFNFQAQIFLYAVLTYLFLYLGLKEISSDSLFLGVTVFFLYLVFYFPSLSIMRQALAASIAFYGCYRYLHRNNCFVFIFFVLLASFFHLSSVVYLLCIPFFVLKPSRYVYISLMMISAVLGFTVFAEILGFIANITGISYKGYSFDSIPIRAPVFYVFTLILITVFFYSLKVSRKEHYFLLNIIFFIVVVRLLAIDYKPLNRVGASFSIFIPVFLYQVFFQRFKHDSKTFALILVFPLLMISDFFRANKDYSYYQYSLNICIYGEPCPVSIVGDLPLEQLLIREELR